MLNHLPTIHNWLATFKRSKHNAARQLRAKARHNRKNK